MPYRLIPFITGEFYHLYNRGLEKQNIFHYSRDYSRFLDTLFYYQIQNPKPKFSNYRISKTFPINPNKRIVDIICYCLMPNHFHLLIKQVKDGGISEFMRKAIHSYTKYRNTKYNRLGPLFGGIFKAVHIESDEQFIHLSRYIHLNPLVTGLVKNLSLYPWSSYNEYTSQNKSNLILKKEILNFFASNTAYQQFVLDQADYAHTLELIKHQAIDLD